jgi:membrane fusion protein, multidrug efflux system
MRIAAWAFLSLAVVGAGCSNRSESAEPARGKVESQPAVKVATAPIQILKMPRYLTLTGSVVADKQSEVAANVAGRVTAAPIERGQAVKAGQVLAVVDARNFAFSATAAAAQSKVAEEQQKLAQSDCARADALMEKGAVSKQEYDRMKTQCAAQGFSASAAQANAELAKKQLGDTTIRAPFDGIVGERYVNVGEYTLAQSKVASLYRINPVRIQVSVPEAATPLIKQGETIKVQVAAFGDRQFDAVVKYVAPALRQQTRDLLVEAVADNKDGSLRPGMFATVQLLVGEEVQPTVPKDALLVDGTIKRLFLARGGQAWEMVVRTGGERDGRVAVLEPLTESERVIVKAPPGLHDGSSVQTAQQ